MSIDNIKETIIAICSIYTVMISYKNKDLNIALTNQSKKNSDNQSNCNNNNNINIYLGDKTPDE